MDKQEFEEVLGKAGYPNGHRMYTGRHKNGDPSMCTVEYITPWGRLHKYVEFDKKGHVIDMSYSGDIDRELLAMYDAKHKPSSIVDSFADFIGDKDGEGK